MCDFICHSAAAQVVIFSSISSMIIMAVCALFHRAAMGGNSEYAVFNLGRTPNPDVLAQKMKEMAELLGQMETKEVEKAFDALAVFDTRRIMNFMTMMSAEVLTGRSDLAYGTRVSSASFQAKAKATQEEVKPAEGGATATV
ncbi:unnamed protein product [Cladocopium goreaui]|uniref:Tyrosine-protein kinase ephrin type A/B receptor-like domain-containing protein n=1 Tax=Cladocopium goreaui TaxID=2562237 RepID=A0A9P1CST3_9DINO|nr:unnamed protein product [Cladocopium goreaui]